MFHERCSASLKLLVCAILFALIAVSPTGALAQSGAAPTITKIDPPNWWVSLPDPMLLVRGENLCGIGPYGFEDRHGVLAPRESATCP
jgi:hypothetical protein